MTNIQIVILFAKLSDFSDEMKEKIKMIVKEEYCSVFGCEKEKVQTILYGGNANGKTTDIHLFIESDEPHYNEGALRLEMRKAISSRLRLLFPSSLGFNGVVTAADGSGKISGSVDENKKHHQPSDSEDSTQAGDFSDMEKRARMYEAVEPKYSFDMVRLPQETIEQINRALGRIEFEKKVFDEWGLYAIMPSPVSALGFFGPPGTGKTLAAEAIASKMEKKIVRVSYADIENKYVGEGPKNVKAVFYAAEKQNAVLFIDEADSLLSKRLTNVSDGTGQAFNSMRSQLLMSLENFHGIAIFATNLVVNYDKAFLSRLISVEFKNPDAALRHNIWETHLLPKVMNGHQLSIPLSEDVNIDELAVNYDLCGRDIRNAVVDACVEACLKNKNVVDQECLRFGAQSRVESNLAIANANDHTKTETKNPAASVIAKAMEEKLKSKNHQKINIDELDGKNEEEVT
ncbi:MAG: ATP-binding protein [Lachnospiraceae bacterium]|nr:ATP-binding protein [Lachnospiraceae bacterium]